MPWRDTLIRAALPAALLLAAPHTQAAVLTHIEGGVTIERDGRSQRALRSMTVEPGTRITTDEAGHVRINHPNGCIETVGHQRNVLVRDNPSCALSDLTSATVILGGALTGAILMSRNRRAGTRPVSP